MLFSLAQVDNVVDAQKRRIVKMLLQGEIYGLPGSDGKVNWILRKLTGVSITLHYPQLCCEISPKAQVAVGGVAFRLVTTVVTAQVQHPILRCHRVVPPREPTGVHNHITCMGYGFLGARTHPGVGVERPYNAFRKTD